MDAKERATLNKIMVGIQTLIAASGEDAVYLGALREMKQAAETLATTAQDPPVLNNALWGRLFNFKFDSALRYLEPTDTEEVQETVRALANAFGNVGHFSGDLATIIAAALKSIGCDVDDMLEQHSAAERDYQV